MSKPRSGRAGKAAGPELTPVERLGEAEAAAELERLAREIAHHDDLYYRDAAPEISDAAYDALRERNLAIEARFPHLVRDDSPSFRIGAAPVEAFGKVTHGVPMLSLGNVFDEEGLRDFLERIASEDEPDVPALKGWRRQLFGEDALKLKRGELALTLSKGEVLALSLPDR